jgi:hypothetical protein
MAVAAMALGSAFAAIAALVLLPLGNIVVEAGYHVLIMAVAVCIVGGLGSWTGAVLAAFLIGFAQILTDVFLGAHFQVVVALSAIIITLILRPSGLFGRQEGTGGEGLAWQQRKNARNGWTGHQGALRRGLRHKAPGRRLAICWRPGCF